MKNSLNKLGENNNKKKILTITFSNEEKLKNGTKQKMTKIEI